MNKEELIYDCIIVGGGVAGLSAALTLGRARLKTLVCDRGNPRNEPAREAHTFFTRDGTPPLELLRIGLEQLKPYESVSFQTIGVKSIQKEGVQFIVTFEDESSVVSRKIILAFGVRDEFPAIENFEKFWGKAVFHCPFCHGFEMRDQPLAVIGGAEEVIEMTGLLRNWSRDLIVCTNGARAISAADQALLKKYEIPFFEQKITRFKGSGGSLEKIVFETGESITRSGALIRLKQTLRSDLAARLGCELTETGHIKISAFGETSVAGVYAAGDATSPMQSIAFSVAQGSAAAGAGVTRALSQESFRVTPSGVLYQRD